MHQKSLFSANIKFSFCVCLDLPLGIKQEQPAIQPCLIWECRQVLNKGSQLCSCPIRGCEMAGIEYEVCRKACPWVGNIIHYILFIFPTYGRVVSSGQFSSQPFRYTYRHGCIAGYPYQMPKGIIIPHGCCQNQHLSASLISQFNMNQFPMKYLLIRNK